MKRLPNFFIVGAAKAGTTSLNNYLHQVPSVFISNFKEPNYFTSIKEEYFDIPISHDKEKYLKHFEGVTNEIAIGETSPRYLWDPQSAILIHDMINDARIIITLRNPVERAFSHYLMLNQSFEDRSFHDAIHSNKSSKKYPLSKRYLELGNYSKQVQRYLDTFGKDNVKIIIFEEWIKDIKNTIDDILIFLKIANNIQYSLTGLHNPYSETRRVVAKQLMANQTVRKITFKAIPYRGLVFLKKILTKKATKPELLDEERKFLEDYYKNEINELEKILNRKLPWKN